MIACYLFPIRFRYKDREQRQSRTQYLFAKLNQETAHVPVAKNAGLCEH